MIEYYLWSNEPTQRELLDAHMASIGSILINANSKTKVKPKDLLLLYTKEDKKTDLTNMLKTEFAKFGDKIKVIEKS